MVNREGAEHSTFVIDAEKIVCPYCNGTRHQTSILGDEPEDITEDTAFTALGLENATVRTGTVALCHCGKTFLLDVLLFDTANADGSTTPALTNLDATVANGLAGWWWVCLQGTDEGKYVRIESNTIATPTVCTLAFLTNADGNGFVMIKKVEPVGMTKITS